MAEDDAAWRGRVIDERYLVEEVIGRGGMGVVLRARHRFTGATVALKVLRDELARDPDLQRRFLAEARAGNAIAHPGIVDVLDAGRDATGALYLAMELLVGESLRAPIRRGLPAPEVRRIALELADVLGAAHTRGFIHRDLKPENVFLVAPTGAVKLLDFGIAKVLATDVGSVAHTASGVMMGTPAYMAPEQLTDARAVDARADLWALGVMLYEMLAGQLPFRGANIEELFVAIATATPAPISTLLPGAPTGLDPFFARALARDPQHRFAMTSELAAAFAALPLGAVTGARGAPTPPPLSVLASGLASAAPSPGLAATQMDTPAPAVRLAASPSAPITGPVLMQTPLPAAAPVLPQPTRPPFAAAPTEPPSRHGLWLGGAVAIAIATVGVAYVATRRSMPTPAPVAVAPAVAPAEMPVDAAAVVVAVTPPPAIEATAPAPAPAPLPAVAPRPRLPPAPAPVHDSPPTHMIPDAVVAPPKPAPPAPPPPPAPRTAAQVCADGCNLAAKCGIGYAQCVSACSGRTDVTACMRDATGCNAVAGCGFLAVCGVFPHGHDTCNKISAIQGMCRDASCGCRAAVSLDINRAQVLALYDGCAVACRLDPACVTTTCARQRAACLAQ